MAEINIDRIGGSGGTPLPLGNLKVDNPLSATLQIVKDTGGNASALYISTIDVTNFGGGAIASNTAFGINALTANTTGSVVGVSSMRINLTGGSNTALGAESLRFNVSGNNNTAIGRNALFDVQTGSDNTAIGYNTGRGIVTGSNNTILGANVTGLSSTLANNIIIADGSGNRRINVDSSGNVGINTLTPSQKLHVNGSLRIETGGIYDGTNNIGTSGQVLSSTGTSTAWITPSGGGGSPSGVAGAIQFSDGSAFASDAANLFYDDTNDRLGVGINVPTARLHVKGSGSTSATTSFLVQNSSGFNAIQVTDDLKVNINTLVFGGSNGYIGINNSPSIDSALRAVRTDSGQSPLSISTGEVGIGDTTTYASAIFAIGSTTRGFLPPRMTTTQRDAIATPATGLKVYNTTTNTTDTYDGATWQRFGQQTFIKGSGTTFATTFFVGAE
jgi:hypothetical protein